jgi:hypothetical protein
MLENIRYFFIHWKRKDYVGRAFKQRQELACFCKIFLCAFSSSLLDDDPLSELANTSTCLGCHVVSGMTAVGPYLAVWITSLCFSASEMFLGLV